MECRRVLFFIFYYIASVTAMQTNVLQDLIVINQVNQNNYTFYPVDNECSRYCIGSTQSQGMNHINFIWKFGKQPSSNGEMLEPMDTKTHDRESNCPIITEIGCEFSSLTGGLIDQFTILKDKRQLQGQSSTILAINNDTETLLVTISGNISWILLEIPIDWEKNEAGLELSLKRAADTNEYHLVANNPPPGGWQLILAGFPDNSIYNLTVLAMKKYPRPVFSQKIDLPGHVRSRAIDSDFVIHPDNLLNKSARVVFDVNDDTIDARADELDELGRITTNSLELNRNKLEINLAQETNLIAVPNNYHPIVFSVTNHFNADINHIFWAQSSNLQVIDVVPRYGLIYSGKTVKVIVYVRVTESNENIASTLNFIVQRQQFPDIQKSVLIYTQTPENPIIDYTDPKIKYSFNDNCNGKLSPEHCADSLWTVVITVTDPDSGLKSVTSKPPGVIPKTNFIAGAKNPTTFLYSSTCCHTMLYFTATDVVGHSYTRTIDVTEWDNLSDGEIAAIVVGSLFILLIIILLILLCVYCIRKRQTTDITYTQRYGSRSTPRTERTTF